MSSTLAPAPAPAPVSPPPDLLPALFALAPLELLVEATGAIVEPFPFSDAVFGASEEVGGRVVIGVRSSLPGWAQDVVVRDLLARWSGVRLPDRLPLGELAA